VTSDLHPTVNRVLAALGHLFGFEHLELTDAQYAGRSCVHCARPFAPGETGEPYGRRMRQCAGFCVLEMAGDTDIDDVLAARVTAFRPSADVMPWYLGSDDDPDPVWLTAQERAVLTLDDGPINARSKPIPLEYAHRLAQQAARLGFDAEIIEHRDDARKVVV
jgi:hypothetical protein